LKIIGLGGRAGRDSVRNAGALSDNGILAAIEVHIELHRTEDGYKRARQKCKSGTPQFWRGRFMRIVQPTLRKVSPLAQSLIPDGLYYWMWSRYFPDRRYMERILLPALARLKPAHVLNVGVRVYCAHYRRYFAKTSAEYWTMDIDPDVARFGQRDRHVIGSVIDADKHFSPGYFDVVSLNGIFGWGVNDLADQIKTLANVRKIMRRGGVLLIGWNDDITKEVVSMAEANGFKHRNSLGLPDRKRFEGRSHVYDLFTAG
jgi:SAM-dependent methyltransferase